MRYTDENMAMSENRRSPITQAFDLQSIELDHLDKVYAMLRERLEPIRLSEPRPESSDKLKTAQPMASPLVSRIEAYTERIRELAAKFEELIQELQL